MRIFSISVAASLSMAAALGFAASASAQPERQRVDFRVIFQQLDANRDGVVTREEVPKKGLEAFDKILKHSDDNDDGKLQSAEIRSLNAKMFRAFAPDVPNSSPEEIAKMDANGDGKVTGREFRAPLPLFGLIDLNRDGALTKDEIEKFGEEKPFKNQPAPEPPMMPGRPGAGVGVGPGAGMFNGDRIRAMDVNRDRKISREEFQGPAQLFDRMDFNKDGFISAEDRDAPGAERFREAMKKGAAKKAERPARPQTEPKPKPEPEATSAPKPKSSE